jgi:hypothetical protein
MLLIGLLAISLGACAPSSSDDDDSSTTCSVGSGSGDTMTVNLNSEGATTYTETAASNEFGADPVVFSARNTTDNEHEVILGCGLNGTVLEFIIRFAVTGTFAAQSYDLSMASYSGTYATSYGTSNQTYDTGNDATAGTLTITSIGGGNVGDTYTGTFNVTATQPIGNGTAGVNTMSGSFSVVREDDET